MDEFRRQMERLAEGPGGHRCPCCWAYIRKRKAIARRVARARLKAQMRRRETR